MKYTLVLLILVMAFRISAQSGERDQPFAVIQSKGKQVHINYSGANSAGEELVVRLADSTGRTIFLENRHRFNGTYNRVIKLNSAAKGYYHIYFLQGSHKLTETLIIE